MRLNMDCVRAVLLWVEEAQQIDATTATMVGIPWSINVPDFIPEYSREDVLYSINQLVDNGMLRVSDASVDGMKMYRILDITPSGHEFLANIRDEGNWSRVKELAVKIGSLTFSTIVQIATNVITGRINDLP